MQEIRLPFFSIITPTYNRAHLLPKTIKSVLAQTYIDFEYIIVDDGSTDNTEDVVRKIRDKRIKYFWKENEERNIARNFGIEKSSGKYLIFLDSDDLLYENYLAEAYSILKGQSIPFLYQGFEIVNENGEVTERRDNFPENILPAICKTNLLSPIGAIIERSVIKNYSFPNDSKFIIGEDLFVWIRIIIRYGIKFNPKVLATYQVHSEQTMALPKSSSIIFSLEKMIELLERDEEYKNIPDHKQLTRSLSYNYYSLAALSCSIEGEIKKSLEYLIKAIYVTPISFFSKRVLAILKHNLINLYELRI